MNHRSIKAAMAAVVAATLLAGCSGRISLSENPDPQLRRTPAQFAADSARRFPFPASAPAGQTTARAEVDYTLNLLRVVNLSAEDWGETEIWVNKEFVVSVPSMKSMDLKNINFRMLFDVQGNHFPEKNRVHLIRSVDIFTGGTLYEVPVKIAY